MKDIEKDWRDTNDFKQAVFAADKLLDEPYADPDDDPRTVARQFERLVERYDSLLETQALALEEMKKPELPTEPSRDYGSHKNSVIKQKATGYNHSIEEYNLALQQAADHLRSQKIEALQDNK